MTPRAQVLVVDDKESVLELMASILRDAYDVATTPDPAHAIALMEQKSFDVLLTDIRMPGATGFDLLAAAKRSRPASASACARSSTARTSAGTCCSAWRCSGSASATRRRCRP